MKDFEVGQLWFDPSLMDYYVVTAVSDLKISGLLVDNNRVFIQYKMFCQDDEYVRDLTLLEWELYV